MPVTYTKSIHSTHNNPKRISKAIVCKFRQTTQSGLKGQNLQMDKTSIALVLHEAGTDINVLTSHSTRAASASKAKQKDVFLDVTMAKVSWTSVNTFQKLYDKPLLSNHTTMASAILTS